MKVSFQLAFLVSSILTTIIRLFADDELRDDGVQFRLDIMNESLLETEQYDEHESVAQTDDPLFQLSEVNISNSATKRNDDSPVILEPNETLAQRLVNDTSTGEDTKHDDSSDNSDAVVAPEILTTDRSEESVKNMTADHSDRDSRQSDLIIGGENLISGDGNSLIIEDSNITDVNNSTVTGEEDEMDSQKARIFVDYASKHSGANIIDKSKDFQGASNLLIDDDDRYAISPCDIGHGGVKYVIIALSEDILVKTIKLLSYERYSSQTKQFQVLGSQTYPISTKWVDLGTFTAKPWYNTDGKQSFDLEQGVWARYLKFRFLTHYGNEHYCTVTQIMVHGSTTLQDFHEEHWSSVEASDNGSKEDKNSITADVDVGKNNETLDILQIASTENTLNSDNLSNSTHSIEDKSSIGRSEETRTVQDTNTVPTTAVSLDVPSTKRSEVDSQYSIDFYQNIILMSSNTFQSIYDTADRDKCMDGTALLAASSKSRAYETAFRNVGNFSVRLLEDATSSILATTNPASKSMVLDAVNSAVRTVVKLSPISDALKGIQRLLHVELLQTSMSPKKRITQPIFKNTEEETSELNEETSAVPDIDLNESDKMNAIYENLDDKISLSPIELNHIARERMILSRVSECLERLNIQEMKMKVTKIGLKGGSAANEPIFKKLADEIKALQVNQGVYDQFIKSATACYQSVITEMMNDMLVFESNVEQRIIQIEQSLSMGNHIIDRTTTWFDLIMYVPKSLGTFLTNTLLEYMDFFDSVYEWTKVRRWRRIRSAFGFAPVSDMALVHWVLQGFNFDMVSFWAGFLAALFIMCILRQRTDVRKL